MFFVDIYLSSPHLEIVKRFPTKDHPTAQSWVTSTSFIIVFCFFSFKRKKIGNAGAQKISIAGSVGKFVMWFRWKSICNGGSIFICLRNIEMHGAGPSYVAGRGRRRL